MNPFDIFVIVLIVLSGLFAFARGFVREALSVGTWVGASLAALYAFPFARPIAERWLAKGIVADAAAALSVFVVVLIALSLVSSAISRRVKDSSLSALDRTLGLLFGLVRGVILACLVYIGVTWALPEANRPPWIKEARTGSLLQIGADKLKALVPNSVRNRAETTAAEAQQRVDQARDAAGAIRALEQPIQAAPKTTDAETGKGYTADQQRDMNRLFQQNSSQ
ncbi:MAG TPA: CvpA family protein [Stellaceae bacterium]|jgi:membrane protein required for colicin V production|nr:CvpA family protein [Stellaceae bacterium]